MTLTQINKAGLDELALDHVFTIGASGSDHYTFQGEGLNGTVNDPTLYLTRGKTYRFENGTGAHPIRIQSTSGASGTAYNTGVTNNAGSGTVIVEVQHDAPDVLYYQCTSHANMNGVLYITGALADGGVTTAKLADDAVTDAKLANSINTAIAANTAKNTNVSTNLSTSTTTTAVTIASSDGTNATIGEATGSAAGVMSTAHHDKLDGIAAGATNSTSTTINNNADNRVITGSGTANTLNGESNVQINSSGIMTIGNDPSGAATLGGDLNIANTSGGTVVVGDTGSGEYLKLYASGSGAYVGSKSNHPLIFFTNDTSNPAMRIDTSGRLKINHTDHPGQLDNTFISIHDTNGGGGISKNYAMMQVNNYGTGSPGDLSGIGFGAGAGNSYIKGSIGFMRTGGYGQGDFTFNLNTDNDTTLVNNTDELVRIQKGGGISFNGDTAAANALNDYEEGTWTPTTANSGGGFQNIVSATYTKIGRLVNVSVYAVFNSGQPNSNQIRIGGLPFQSISTIYHYAVGRFQGFADNDVSWQVGGTSDYFTPYYNNAIPTYNQVNGYYFLVSGSYITDS